MELITKLRLNEHGAWAEFYDSIATDLRRYISRIGARDPDDILGEVMVQIVRDIGSFHGTSAQLRPWAFRIAYNRVVDASRKRSVRPTEVSTDFSQDDAQPYVSFEAPLSIGELSDLLDDLTNDQKSAVWLRYVEDMSVTEVAQVMEKSPEAVAALTHRAIRQLRKAFAP